MTPIRVNVQLINAIDEPLIVRGFLAPDLLHRVETEALVNTSVLALVIPPTLVEPLGLRIRRRGDVEVGDGVRIHCQGREAMVEALVMGNEVVIGRAVLALMDLVVDCENHRLILNPAHPDYPVARI